ncbi:PIG-L family deacetylase [Marinicrinis lubricantis]|uniref:PIG-L family deacetylase n=1 Tax=Marinicrinis lubricantis TaxID=2086470 RepID=A0ABW1INI3_9BACL
MEQRTRQMAALLAHPDDESFIFGGTIAHYAKQGVKVHIVSATKGEMGRRMGHPPFITRETMPMVREKELEAACSMLGAEQPIFLGHRDKTVEFVPLGTLTDQLLCILEKLQPEVVLTFHPEWGGHPDHCAIGKAAIHAVRQLEANPAFYFISFGESLKRPQRYGLTSEQVVKIDVRDSLFEKLNAFRAHRTQTEMDEWVWQEDQSAIRHFSSHEYFIIADDLPRKQWNDLFI